MDDKRNFNMKRLFAVFWYNFIFCNHTFEHNEPSPRSYGGFYILRLLCVLATSPASNTQAYIGLVTGVLAMVVLLLGCTVLLMVRRGRKKVALLHKHTALVTSTTRPGVTINMKVIYLLYQCLPF